MVLDEAGLSRLWERIIEYVNEYVETYDSLAIATTFKMGQVRPDGITITVDADGTIHSVGGGGDGEYVLPVASASSLGCVRVDGRTITIDDLGIIHSASTYVLPAATGTSLGGVIPDGVTIGVDEYGVITVLGSDGQYGAGYMSDSLIEELTPYDDIIPSGDEEGY